MTPESTPSPRPEKKAKNPLPVGAKDLRQYSDSEDCAIRRENLDATDLRFELSDNPNRCPHCHGFCFAMKPGLPTPPPCTPCRSLKGAIVYIQQLIPLDRLPKKYLKMMTAANTHMKEGYPLVYVGQTCLTAEQRTHNHYIGNRGSRWVRRFGRGLMTANEISHLYPDVCQAVLAKVGALMDRSPEDPQTREALVAELLRGEGLAVIVN